MPNPLSTAQQIHLATGKPVVRQLFEAIALRMRASPVGLSEYFEYGIWNPAHSAQARDEFIGWRESQNLDRTLNEVQSRVLANDKLLNYLVLKAGGFPIPEPVATYSQEQRRIAAETILSSKEELRAFLSGDVFPFFSKPISAGYGRGVSGVEGWADASTLKLLDGTTVGFDKYFADFEFPPYKGMLLQKCLTAHPEIQAITGTPAVSCVRMICFVTSRGPVVHTAFWKITTGRNMLDNFSHGDFGNCLGAVDLDTGTITHAIGRMGLGGAVSAHPTTGRPLIGFRLPDWERALDLVKSATRHFPGLRLQNWDVALCDTGPVLVELNTESELAVPQAISSRGLMDQRLKDILADISQSQAALRKAVQSRG